MTNIRFSLLNKIESNRIYPYIYLIPVLILLVSYILYPMVFSIYISLLDWNGMTPLKEATFTSFNNYIKLFQDRLFWTALRNSTIYTAGTLIFENLFGLTLALTLFYSNIKGSKLWRAIIFFPAILSPVIVGLVWRLIYAKEGLINQILESIGLDSLQRIWLGNPVTPIYAITIISIWQWSGYNMVLYYAGLQGLNNDLIDAARVDGANGARLVLKIILPLISRVVTIAMVLNLIGGFKVFDIVYATTRGGPANVSHVLTTYMFFNAFASIGSSDFGYSSAIAVVLTIIILFFVVIRIRTTKTF